MATAPPSCNGAAAGAVTWTYFAGADPLPTAGVRFFGLNQNGTIYQSAASVVVTQTGVPPGAIPVQ